MTNHGGKGIQPFSKYKDEGEVLLPPGTTVAIRDVVCIPVDDPSARHALYGTRGQPDCVSAIAAKIRAGKWDHRDGVYMVHADGTA